MIKGRFCKCTGSKHFGQRIGSGLPMKRKSGHYARMLKRRFRSFLEHGIDGVVNGGCHERDTGYEAFSGGEYPWREGWVEKLIEDYEKEEDELDGTWFNTLNFDEITVIIMGCYGPIVLQFYRGEMIVTVSYDNKEKEQVLLSKFEEAFGKSDR